MDGLAGFLGDLPDAACLIDRERRIVVWNEAACRLLGHEARAVLGRYCCDVFGNRRVGATRCFLCEDHRGVSIAASVRLGDENGSTRSGNSIRVRGTTTVFPSSGYRLTVLTRHEGDPAAADPDGLTPREGDVLRLLAQGESTAGMAERLLVRKTTVRTHVQHVLSKLGAHSRLQAVTHGQRMGLL